MSAKPVEKSSTQYVRTFVEATGEKLIYLVWVVKENKKTGKNEDRLLAVSRSRIFTFKTSPRQKVCKQDHIYNLKTLVYRQEKKIELHFEAWFIKFSHPNAGMLVKHIVESINRVCSIWPTSAKPKIDANPLLLSELKAVSFDPTQENGAAGFLATYDALCSLHSVVPCETFKQHAREAFIMKESHSLYLHWHGPRMEAGHVKAFAGTILHDTWFTDVSFGIGGGIASSNMDVVDAAVNTIGPTLSRVKHLLQLRFRHAKLSARGAQCIVHALQANNGLQLQLLDLSYNSLNDTVVRELATCLVRSHSSTLAELHLCDCSVSGKGIASMIDIFLANSDFLQRLTVLNVSHNTLGKRGTSKLLELIQNTSNALKRLDVSATGIQITTIADAFRVGENNTLVSLAVGENRLTAASTTALCKLLSSTDTIAAINLSGVVNSNNESQNKKDRLQLLATTATFLFNPHLPRTSLRMASNMMDAAFGAKLAAMCRDSRSLVKLDVSECGLGDEMLGLLFQGFTEASHSRIEMLNVSRNSREAEDHGAGKWLGRLVENCPSLKSLDVAGGRDAKAAKNSGKQVWALNLSPLFHALRSNNTLEECNISCNALKDTDMSMLLTSIESNESSKLRSIQFSGNNITTSMGKKAGDFLTYNPITGSFKGVRKASRS